MYDQESDLDAGTPYMRDLGTYSGDRNTDGERHGKGDTILPNGDRYRGEYKYGKRNGEGSYNYAAAKYTGTFEQGRKQGYGIMVYPDGSRYEGNWEQGEKTGDGKYIYTNGDVYEGEWKNDKRNGQGTYTYRDTGAQSIGTWIEGEQSGEGKMKNESYSYSGHFSSGLPTGSGALSFKCGCTQHGFYTMTDIVKQVDKRMELVGREPVWTCTKLTRTR